MTLRHGKTARKGSHSRCILEALESRTLLSGTVTVTYTPTSVTIRGQNVSQQIRVSDSGTGTPYTVTALDGTTTIRTKGTAPGSTSLINFNILMGSKTELVQMDVSAAENVTLKGGGIDTFAITGENGIVGKVNVTTGSGNASVSLSGFFAGAVKVTTGNGDDEVTAGQANIAALTISTGRGKDTVTLGLGSGLRVAGATSINLGSGDDTLILAEDAAPTTATFVGNVSINLSSGNDTISANQSGSEVVFEGKTSTINFSSGNDTGDVLAGVIHLGAGSGTTFTDPSGVKDESLFASLLLATLDGLPKAFSVRF